MAFKAVAAAIVLTLSAMLNVAAAGPLAYAICQTGCNTLACACYGAAGFTMGTS